MTTSSIFLGVAGIACLFGPEETTSALGRAEADPLIVQLLGAFYLGFGASNWLARGTMIGGIYARPLSVANFWHFLIGATVLVKQFLAAASLDIYGVVTLVYVVFAAAFAWILFGGLEAGGNRE